MYRIGGKMVIDEEEKLKPLEVEELLNPLLTQEQYEYLEETGNQILQSLFLDLAGCVSMYFVNVEPMHWR